jgi:hypothetical protein
MNNKNMNFNNLFKKGLAIPAAVAFGLGLITYNSMYYGKIIII